MNTKRPTLSQAPPRKGWIFYCLASNGRHTLPLFVLSELGFYKRFVRIKIKRCLPLAGFLAALSVVSLSAHAAGGHHAVDDAAMLDVGKCKLEGRVERETGGARSLYHLGAGCRVGPVEPGLNIDGEKQAISDAATRFGPQIKWAYALNKALSIGAAASRIAEEFASRSSQALAWRHSRARGAGHQLGDVPDQLQRHDHPFARCTCPIAAARCRWRGLRRSGAADQRGAAQAAPWRGADVSFSATAASAPRRYLRDLLPLLELQLLVFPRI